MSLSTQDRQTNPAKFFLKVKSGAVTYYDKEAGENVDVPVPFEFIMLDQLGTIKGWSDADNSGYWSNEVKRSGTDEVTVRTSKGVKATGLWKDIKSDPNVAGAKFNASVYIAHVSGDGLVISNIAFSGAALNAWIEFIQANKGVARGNSKVMLSGFSDAKKGAVKYKVPVFEVAPVSSDEVAAATALDKDLQLYFADYMNQKQDEPKDELKAVDSSVIDVAEDDKFDLADIPF
jgi:hypothetical protein